MPFLLDSARFRYTLGVDANQNPYYPGAGIPPATLAGRDADINAFRVAITRLGNQRPARGMILTGLRGMGKTVLLSRFSEIALANEWEVETLETSEGTDLPSELGHRISRMMRYLTARHRPVRSRLETGWQRASEVVRAFQMRWQIGEVQVSANFDSAIGGSGDLKIDLIDLFDALGELTRAAETGALLTVDEMHNISRQSLTALLAACHHVSQRQYPVLIVGAGLPSLPAQLNDAQTYSERLFSYSHLGELDESSSARALTEASAPEDVTWDPEATKFIVDASFGYPYFLQEFGRFTWDVAPGPNKITLADTQRAVPLAQTYLDEGFFSTRINTVPVVERRYLRAMAELGGGPYRSGDIARHLSKTHQELSSTRQRLIDRGLIYSPKIGLMDFTVPMFDQFLVRLGE
jgi:hypothetical protein